MSDLSIRFENYDEGFFHSSSKNASETEKKEKSDDKIIKAVKIIFAVLISCIVLEFCFYMFIRPSLSAPKVSVSGQSSYTPLEIVSMLKPMNVKNWFDFDVESAVSILASVSGFDSVTVKKSFPDKIYINIVEREPVAMTFINNNGRSVPVQIDKSGVIFPERIKKSYSSYIPIVSGLPIEHLTEGMRIPAKYRTLIDQISVIRGISQKYFAAISEICVVPKEYGNYELVLIPAGSKIKVLTDRSLNEDALKYMMVALDVVNSIEPDVSEIDLRYGSVSYRRK